MGAFGAGAGAGLRAAGGAGEGQGVDADVLSEAAAARPIRVVAIRSGRMARAGGRACEVRERRARDELASAADGGGLRVALQGAPDAPRARARARKRAVGLASPVGAARVAARVVARADRARRRWRGSASKPGRGRYCAPAPGICSPLPPGTSAVAARGLALKVADTWESRRRVSVREAP